MFARFVAIAVSLTVLLGGCASVDRGGLFASTELAAIDNPNDIAPPVGYRSSTGAASWTTFVAHGLADESAADIEFGQNQNAPYKLDSGDKLRIFVYAQPSLSRLYTIDNEGFISVPLIGNVSARGMTTRGLEGVIRGRLGAEYVRDPHVTVDIQQPRPFFILGEVKSAGQYPYVGRLTVDAAVAIAGGYSERANERKVQITRRIKGGIEKLEVPGDAEVLPGDTIYIKERWF